MYIFGSFINKKGEEVTVRILTQKDNSTTLEIGTEASDVYFQAENAVEITGEANDTFDVILPHSASVRLLCGDYIPDFFCNSCRDAVINIYRAGEMVFCGYIEPQTYSQSYNERWDEVELSCIDCLSALQYSKYKDIGSLGVSYNVIKTEATQRTFFDILKEIVYGVTDDVVIGEDGTTSDGAYIFYDGSKAVDSDTTNKYSIFSQLSISELLFLGDEEDDVWTQQEVLEAMLKYLNLHVTQEGTYFNIFSWETIRNGGSVYWRNLIGGSDLATISETIDISLDNVEGTDTQISVPETYNQLLLTCDITEMDNIVESPLDDDSLSSWLGSKVKYMTEYAADGEGVSAIKAFYNMVHGISTDWGDASQVDWFVELKRNSQWAFPVSGYSDIYDNPNMNASDVNYMPKYICNSDLTLRRIKGCIVAVGSKEQTMNKQDNSPTANIDMTDCLVIAVNGNGKDGENTYKPSSNDILASCPVAVYTGNTAGGVFSPADDNITNYIIISGKIALNPIMALTDDYPTLLSKTGWGGAGGTYWHKTVPSRNNDDGRYYTQQYWKASDVKATPEYDAVAWEGWYPYTGKGAQEYQFKYSAVGDSTDTISKIAVLACMLVIGDKCVVEKLPDDDLGTGVPYTGEGKPSDFVWKTYKGRSECTSDDEYYRQCFYIGFNPKLNDYLVGTEFDIQLNYDYTYGIDGDDGTAIPIKRSDKVSGQVKFQILGPVNVIWDEITRRHPSFWRHTKWSTNSVPLMAHVSSIIVKDFEVTVASDNGGLSSGSNDTDLVYMSDTAEDFVNKKDDIDFKISSALTLDECKTLGVSQTVNISTPLNVSTEEGVLSIYDRPKGEQVKAEQDYVDSYYNEWHTPHVVMEQTLRDEVSSKMTGAQNGIVSFFNHYRHPAMGKTFHVQSITRDLMEGSATVTMKEIKE